jgi:hypothetical protein
MSRLGPLNPRLGLVLAGLWLGGCEAEPPALVTPYAAPASQVTLAATEAPLVTAVPTAAEACVNSATYQEDLTVPDGSIVAPGERLDKRWSVRNSGSCDWGPQYRLVRLDAGAVESRDELALYPARAGTQAVWQVELIAPETPGEYLASWQARAPNGEFFGEQVFVLIEVRR